MIYNIIAYNMREYRVYMTKIDAKLLKNGLDWKEYLSSMTENQENFYKQIENVKSKTDLHDSMKKLESKLENKNLIILTEDFCPDSLFNIPIFIMISGLISNLSLKIYRRSENEYLNMICNNLELMKIPAVLITDKNLEILYKWEEKPQRAYKIQSNLLIKNKAIHENNNDSNLTLKDLMINSLENEYTKSLWSETISEIDNISKIN
tara:strand:- start:8755 stop:9375 length:621 start_codon:yes stop_codon:yes gene_type:complete